MRNDRYKQDLPIAAEAVDVRAVAPEQRYLIVALVAQMAKLHPAPWPHQERRGAVRLRVV